MVDRGAGLWMASLAASRARTLVEPESRKASSAATAPAFFTSTLASFARLNPDGSISKTSMQCSLFPQEESFSENLPAWGSMRSGELFERPVWVPRTGASELSCWPTSVVSDGQQALERNPRSGLMLAAVVKLWTTPQAHDSSGGDAARVGRYGTEHGGKNLADDVVVWATPATSWYERGQPTPESWEKRQSMRTSQGKARFADPLDVQAMNWGTPTTRDWKDGDCSQANVETNSLLGRQVTDWTPSPSDLRTPNGPTCWCGTPGCGLRSHRRKLNPDFVDWLMGWPLRWTDVSTVFAPAAMELYLCRARSLCENLCAGSAVLPDRAGVA